MDLFYALPEDIEGSHLTIKGQEAKHITKVLRYRVSDKIVVTDGMGTQFQGEISDIHQSAVTVSILSKQVEKRVEPFVTVCMGNIKKRDRLEFAVEKITELGADRIIIFKGEHSQKENVRADRLHAATLAAMKQSLRLYLPEIHIESSLKNALNYCESDDLLIVADETVDKMHQTKAFRSDKTSFFLVIGPEGGFSLRERELMDHHHAMKVSLGEKRLRTETAAVIMTDRFKNRT
ncbi:MAG: RsmE family RNA methyltransferase [Balneolaceae bacterium]